MFRIDEEGGRDGGETLGSYLDEYLDDLALRGRGLNPPCLSFSFLHEGSYIRYCVVNWVLRRWTRTVMWHRSFVVGLAGRSGEGIVVCLLAF